MMFYLYELITISVIRKIAYLTLLVQQICGDDQKNGSVDSKSIKICIQFAKMILFATSYGLK